MSKEQSTILKGIAILMMLFYHLFYRTEINELCYPLLMINDMPLVFYISQACYPVPFFLILSGYGLTYLYKNNHLCILSESRRLLKLYIHYWIVLFIFMPIAYLIKPHMYQFDILHIIGNLTAIRCNYNGEVWFLFPYAIISLTSFYIIRFIYHLKDKRTILFVAITYAILFLIIKYLSYNLSEHIVLNIIEMQIIYFVILVLYFILGIILFRLLESNYLLPFNKKYIYVILLICLIIIKSFVKITIADGLYALGVIIILLHIPFSNWIKRIFIELGQKSMPMWMTHTFFCAYLWPDFIYGFKYPLLIFTVLVIISYVTAIPIMWVSKKIIKLIRI